MTTPADVVRSMFEHHQWATEFLIHHLDRLPAEQLDASVPGSYGSMIDTLTPMIDAETRYLLRLRDPAPPPPEDRVVIPLAQLRSEMPEHGRKWDKALTDLGAGTLHAAILGRDPYPDTDPGEPPRERPPDADLLDARCARAPAARDRRLGLLGRPAPHLGRWIRGTSSSTSSTTGTRSWGWSRAGPFGRRTSCTGARTSSS